jgi:hypothetical protein
MSTIIEPKSAKPIKVTPDAYKTLKAFATQKLKVDSLTVFCKIGEDAANQVLDALTPESKALALDNKWYCQLCNHDGDDDSNDNTVIECSSCPNKKGLYFLYSRKCLYILFPLGNHKYEYVELCK